MLTSGTAELLHIVGYLTGASLYAMLLSMVAGGRGDRLILATALLGLSWNVGELTAHVFSGFGMAAAADWLSAGSYAALGLLAAVAVHSAAQAPAGDMSPVRGRSHRAVAATAYASAGAAAVLQAVAAARGDLLPSPPALILLTGGLAVVAVPLVVLTRRQAHGRRTLSMAALGLFAVSALHLSRFHGASEGWAAELIGHHASIPLAFAILYQDYRFALADRFLKHALTLLALVGIVFPAWSFVASTLLAGAALRPESVAALLGIWVATVLAFPWIRHGISTFVDHVILRRIDYPQFTDAIAALVQRGESPAAVLDATCARLASALGADAVTWTTADDSSPAAHETLVPTAEAPHYVLTVGRLAGGRRLLSDDARMLERVAFLLARRIDALRISEERYQRALREHEIGVLAAKAELRALRAQINPHFLFNALTTVGYLIQEAPPRALDTLMRLTALLRAALRSEGEFTTLGQERELVESYLEIERERFEERLVVDLDVPDTLRSLRLPALVVQPLVENAIKHGVAGARTGGRVSVSARIETVEEGQHLCIHVRNTGAPLRALPEDDPHDAFRRGIGLQNVARRLEHYYGGAASLTLTTTPDGATLAEIKIPVQAATELAHALAERTPA